MRMIGLSVKEDDDRQFIGLVQKLIHGVVQTRMPKDYCVVRVDNWFGDRWLNFTGKILGQLGFRKLNRITFPPFVPSRLGSYTLFSWNDDKNEYVGVEEPRLVHKWQKSTENFQNFVDRAYPDSAFFWFSGNTKLNSRGSVMGYVAGSYPARGLARTAERRDRRAEAEQPFWTWYLEFKKEGPTRARQSPEEHWKHSKAINITPGQVQFYVEKSECPVSA